MRVLDYFLKKSRSDRKLGRFFWLLSVLTERKEREPAWVEQLGDMTCKAPWTMPSWQDEP